MTKYRFSEHGVGYKVGRFLQPYRPQNKIILDWIKPGSRVLDVGCGDGVLGKMLIEQKNCKVYGIDRDETAVKIAGKHGIGALVGNLDFDRIPFGKKSLDYVVASDSLQYLKRPDFALSEMLRAGKSVIVYFPNFGFWFYRFQTLFGRFPRLSLYGHEWWNTQQTRFFSLHDFMNLPVMKNVTIKRLECIDWKNRDVSLLAKLSPNLFGRSCLLKLE